MSAEEPTLLHNHPTEGPVVSLHVHEHAIPGPKNPGHVFGPFPSEAIAMAWEREHADDCHRVILDILDPGEKE